MAELEDVVSYTARLKSILPAEIQIAALHGKMKPAQKNRIMEAFAAQQIDILVSPSAPDSPAGAHRNGVVRP